MSTRLERLQKRARIVHDWRAYAKKIALSAKKLLGSETEVYVFGSAVRGETIAASDVDILVILKLSLSSIIERNKVRLMLEEDSMLPDIHPFQIHVVDKTEAGVYFRHAGAEIVKINA